MKRDKRVIDLRKKIPDYIPWPSSGGTEGSTTREQSSLEPIQLTLCAGDGLQNNNGKMVTDIEWFTTGIEGFFRELKPTNVFCCSPDYNPDGLQHNIEYLAQHKKLQVLLVLCDTTNPVHLERFKELFSNRITTIREDLSCYGPALSTDILQKVLVTGGQYIIDDHRKYNTYLAPSVPRTDGKFTYELADNQLIITKISGSKRRNQSAGTRRKKRNKKKKEGSKGNHGFPL
jgi:hypothetical protein